MSRSKKSPLCDKDLSTQLHDPVNNPSHYTSHPSGVECIQIAEHMSYNVGCAIKHLWRANLKGATIQDLEKAEFFVRREIERLEELQAAKESEVA